MAEQNYYQKEIETMPLEDMKKLQSEKLVKQVKHVYENVAYYRDLMDKKGVSPDDIKSIDDLHKLPFLSKADLPTAFWQSPLRIAFAFNPPRAPRGAALWLSIHKRISTFGRIAPPAPSLPLAARKKTFAKWHTAMVCSQAARA